MALNKVILRERRNLTEDVIELEFQGDPGFVAEAGQFITFKVTDKVPPCFRAYSLASKPVEGKFDLCVKVVEGGRASNWLNDLEIGAELEFLGPSGKFIFQPGVKNHLFVATGTGIAPFKAMLGELILKHPQEKFTLLFGVRHMSDAFYSEYFEKLANSCDNFKFILTLSRPENEEWQGSKGRVTQALPGLGLVAADTDVYICGLKVMIEEVVGQLKTIGFSEEQIHFEKYD